MDHRSLGCGRRGLYAACTRTVTISGIFRTGARRADATGLGRPAPARGGDRRQGRLGFTPCGSDLQQIASFAPQAQARIDRYLEQGGALEFFIEGRASVDDGHMLIKAVDRFDDDTRECERGEGV